MTMTTARIAGLFYLLVLMTGGAAILADGRYVVAGDAAATAANILAHEASYRVALGINLMAMVGYVVVTALFYDVFKPVSRRLSLTAACVSVAGCATGVLGALLQLAPLFVLKPVAPLRVFTQQLQSLAFVFVRWSAQASVTSLVLFGLYCLLIAFLMMKAAFPVRRSQPC